MTFRIISSRVAISSARLIAIGGLVFAADFLFFDSLPGINMALFALLLCLSILYTGQKIERRRFLFSNLFLCALSFATLSENISWISGSLTLISISALATTLEAPWYRNALAWLLAIGRFLLSVPLRAINDLKTVRKLTMRARRSRSRSRLAGWLLPLAMTGVFTFLLSAANPMIARWIGSLFHAPDTSAVSFGRLVLWLLTIVSCWPFLSARMKARKASPESSTKLFGYSSIWLSLFSPQAVVRSLVLFNLLFGLETVLDLVYLWAGAELPAGMTYAQYAHRGAYPLLATALLAGAFVLVTMHRGSPCEHNKSIRTLVYLWVGQNIILTFSSIERLMLYIDVYSLTYFRIAALIWMGLVSFGLLLIIFRLWRDKTNIWLINANILTGLAVLLASGFTDFGSKIAWSNVHHSMVNESSCHIADLAYLRRIGPSALPALYWYHDQLKDSFCGPYNQQRTGKLIHKLEQSLALASRDWRAMTYRDYRLLKNQ